MDYVLCGIIDVFIAKNCVNMQIFETVLPFRIQRQYVCSKLMNIVMKDAIEIINNKKIIVALLFIIHLFTNNTVYGQSWSLEYVLNGDSTVYALSSDKILQGKSVDFFFPAYKHYESSLTKAIKSVQVGNEEIIEIKFNVKNLLDDKLNFEIDLYSEGIDSIWFFLRKTDDELVSVKRQITPKGYTYLPTIYFSADVKNTDYKSLQIVGKTKSERDSLKLILGRLNGYKKIEFRTSNIRDIDAFVSKFPFGQQSDLFEKLPGIDLKLHGFGRYSRLVLSDCVSTFDSIQCISQFTNKLLDEYNLYDVYGINKKDLLSRNQILSKTAQDIESYYDGMKEIIASLNCCHIRLSTNQIDAVESPSQPIYFYKIKDDIVVTAIFDPTLNIEIQLGDKLVSINNIPIDQVYKDFAKTVYASTPHQREMKITQRLLYTAMETWGDSLMLEFRNSKGVYSSYLNKTNYSNKRVIPTGFKIAANNKIEKYGNIIFLRPDFTESIFNPFMYSNKEELNNCTGLIIDLRGNSGGDFSSLTLFSSIISEKSPIIYNESKIFNTHSEYIVKPSDKIRIHAPIVLIVDARTTCIGELLINALRKRNLDIYVIGVSNTTGSAQLAIMTILPGDAILAHFDGITKDAFGKMIDNNIGVVPDSLIQFESYKDLLPYEDILKRAALEYFGYTKHNNVE